MHSSDPKRGKSVTCANMPKASLAKTRAFTFVVRNGSLNLRAHNLVIFLQMAQGIDDQTWTHHLRSGEYSRWFGEAIKDDELAAETRAVEQNEALSAQELRGRIKKIVERRYTAPAKAANRAPPRERLRQAYRHSNHHRPSTPQSPGGPAEDGREQRTKPSASDKIAALAAVKI